MPWLGKPQTIPFRSVRKRYELDRREYGQDPTVKERTKEELILYFLIILQNFSNNLSSIDAISDPDPFL